jgi:U-box domain
MDIIPTEFVCPITMEIMVHPVATRYGQSFERSALVAWLDQGSDECPLTRRPLRMRDLINNHLLAKQIRQWQELHGMSSDSSVDDSKGSERGQEWDCDDDVLVFMYGTTSPFFQLPSVSADFSPRTLTVESMSRQSPPRTAAANDGAVAPQPDSPNLYNSTRTAKSRPVLRAVAQRFRSLAPSRSDPRRQ